jgi:YaiO family outer membrane protein
MTVLAVIASVLMVPAATDTLPEIGRSTAPIVLDAGYARDGLSGDRDDWEEMRVRATRVAGVRRSTFAEGRASRRFGVTDVEGRTGIAFPVGAGSVVEVEASASPGAVVLPGWSLGGHIQTPLGAGWSIGGGARHASYREGGATVTSTIIERYFGDFRAAYRLSVGLLDGERAPGHQLAASWYRGDGSSLNGSVSLGREIERSGADALLVTRASSVSFWGMQRITDRVGLTFGAGFHRLHDLHDRTSAQAGVRVRLER